MTNHRQMSRMSDYALALREEERWRGKLDDEAERQFRIAYIKDRLPKETEQQPTTEDNGIRETGSEQR